MPARTSQNHPKLWRKSRGGKDYGNFYVTLLGKDVNLGTQNAELAGVRRAEAAKGRRGWPSDADDIARAMEPTTEQLAAAAPRPSSAPPPPPPPASLPIAPPAAAPIAPPVAAAPAPAPPPDPPADTQAQLQLPPMSEENQRAEADATNAAAAGTGAATDGPADPKSGAPAEPDAVFTPGQLDELMHEVATAIVIGQIELQAWLIKKRTGKIAPPIAPGSKLHELAAGAWVAQFNLWFPKVDDLPPVALAIGLPMLFMLKQAKEATEPPPKNGHNPPAPPTPATAAEQTPPIGDPSIVVS